MLLSAFVEFSVWDPVKPIWTCCHLVCHLSFRSKDSRPWAKTHTQNQECIIDRRENEKGWFIKRVCLMNFFFFLWAGYVKDTPDLLSYSLAVYFHTLLIPPPVTWPPIQPSKSVGGIKSYILHAANSRDCNMTHNIWRFDDIQAEETSVDDFSSSSRLNLMDRDVKTTLQKIRGLIFFCCFPDATASVACSARRRRRCIWQRGGEDRQQTTPQIVVLG